MSGSIRFTWLRPGGWTRIGVVAAIAGMFGTPMLWTLGAFGADPDSMHRAIVFGASAVWFFFIIGYGAGWAMRGFIIRQKEHDEDDEPAVRRAPPPAAAHPHPPPHRPSGH